MKIRSKDKKLVIAESDLEKNEAATNGAPTDGAAATGKGLKGAPHDQPGLGWTQRRHARKRLGRQDETAGEAHDQGLQRQRPQADGTRGCLRWCGPAG